MKYFTNRNLEFISKFDVLPLVFFFFFFYLPRVCTELDRDEVSCIHLYNHSRVGAEGRALLDSVGLELDLSNSQGVVEYLSNSAHLLG